MGKGLIFFCCACFILVLTIVNLSIGPIVSGTVKNFFNDNWGTLNCEKAKDSWDEQKDDPSKSDDEVKYDTKYLYDICIRRKGMHDMEYTSFIFDIIIGFICGLLGLLHLFDQKKDLVSNTGLIGLICGIIGFALTLVYVIFNGIVYTTVYVDNVIRNKGIYKRDGDYAIAEKDGNNFKCIYFDHKDNDRAKYAKISDLGKKQYNYDKDGLEDLANVEATCKDYEDITGAYIKNVIANRCSKKETYTLSEVNAAYSNLDPSISNKFDTCQMIYMSENVLDELGIENKDLSDRFLTALILSLFVCLSNIGLALFGFLLFRTPGDF